MSCGAKKNKEIQKVYLFIKRCGGIFFLLIEGHEGGGLGNKGYPTGSVSMLLLD